MKNLIYLLVILLFGSCATQKRCLQKFPISPEIIRHDSIVVRDSVVYRDRIVYDTIRGDTVLVEGKVRIVKEAPISDTIKAENDYALAKAWVDNRKLKLQLEQKEQVIERKLKAAEIETTHWRERYETLKELKVFEKKYIPKIYKFTFWAFWVIVLLAGVAAYFRIRYGALRNFLK